MSHLDLKSGSAFVHAWEESEPPTHEALMAQSAWPSLEKRTTQETWQRWVEEMVSLGYLNSETLKLNTALLKNGEAKKRDDMVMRTMTRCIYEFAYNPDDPKDIYWRKRSDGETAPFSRVPVDKDGPKIKKEVRRLYELFFKISPSAETKACVDNVIQSIDKEADLANGLWYTCDGLFWDAESCVLVPPNALGMREVYKEIGSASMTPGVLPELINDEFNRWTELFAYSSTHSIHGELLDGEKDWESFYKKLPLDYGFVKIWAKEGSQGWVDRYWDTCIATATNFMYHKPPIMYMLKGKTRNGKSAYVSHLHGLIGRHQTTDLTLADLADWSLNNALFGSLLNAPDEDLAGELNAKATAAFKTISAKTEMKVPVKYSSMPLRIIPRFMIFDPRNDPPKFFGDPIPCMKRIRFIFFLNDLTKLDNKPKDFWKETFEDNPTLLSKYIGFLLALAKYFSEHEMWYSKTMMASSDYMAETIASTTLYYKYFTTFYAGFESWDILKRDYFNFCKERGYKPNEEAILRQEFFQEGQNFKRRYYPGTKEKIYMYTAEDSYSKAVYDSGKHILCRREPIPKHATAGEVIDAGMSCVDILAKMQDGELEESIMKTKPFDGLLEDES